MKSELLIPVPGLAATDELDNTAGNTVELALAPVTLMKFKVVAVTTVLKMALAAGVKGPLLELPTPIWTSNVAPFLTAVPVGADTVAVPEQVAVPLIAVADVAAEVLPPPVFVITSAVPPAMVLVPVKATVAVPPALPLLNVVRLHVCPVVPTAVMPEV